jgi:uncharacterized protein (TIGR03067 family)
MNATMLFIAATIGAPALKEKLPTEPAIKGEWKVESRFNFGKPSTDQNLWIFSGGGVAEIRDPTGALVISNLSCTLSSDGQFKTIDFLESQPRNGRGNPRQGIYKIEDDTLTLSFVVGDNGDTARPTSFDPSKAHCVVVLKRVKK